MASIYLHVNTCYTCLLLFLSAPICLILQYVFTNFALPVMILTALALYVFLALAMVYFIPKPDKWDPWLYIFVLLSFGSAAHWLFALELTGYLQGTVDFFTKIGGDYLKSNATLSLLLWNGSVHFVLQIMIISAIYKGTSYRNLGLYWAGSFLNNIIVFFAGAIYGPFPLDTLLLCKFIPSLTLPLLFIIRSFRFKPPKAANFKVKNLRKLIFSLALIFVIVLFLLRTLALNENRQLAYKLSLTKSWNLALINEFALNSPNSFDRIQILLYAFYFVPLLCYMLLTLCFCCELPYVFKDISFILAGAVSNAAFGAIAPYCIHTMNDKLLVSDNFGSLLSVHIAIVLIINTIAWWTHDNCDKVKKN